MFRLCGLVLCLKVFVDSATTSKRIVGSSLPQTVEFATIPELLTFNLSYFPAKATDGKICICYRTLETTDVTWQEPCRHYGRICIFHKGQSYSVISHREKIDVQGSRTLPQPLTVLIVVKREKAGFQHPEITVTVQGDGGSYMNVRKLKGDKFRVGDEHERPTVELFLYESNTMHGSLEIADVFFAEDPPTTVSTESTYSTTPIITTTVVGVAVEVTESPLPVGAKIGIAVAIIFWLIIGAIIVARCIQGVWCCGYGIFAARDDDFEQKSIQMLKKKKNKDVELPSYFDPNAPAAELKASLWEPQSEADVSMPGSQPASDANKNEAKKEKAKNVKTSKESKKEEPPSSSKKASEEEDSTTTDANKVLLVKTVAENCNEKNRGHTKGGIKNRHYSQIAPAPTTTGTRDVTEAQKTVTLVTGKDVTSKEAQMVTATDKTRTSQEKKGLATADRIKTLLNTSGNETALEKSKDKTKNTAKEGFTQQDTVGLGHTQAQTTRTKDTMPQTSRTGDTTLTQRTGETQRLTATKGTQSMDVNGRTRSQDTQAPTKIRTHGTSKQTQSVTGNDGEDVTQQQTIAPGTGIRSKPALYHLSEPTLTTLTSTTKETQKGQSVGGTDVTQGQRIDE